jgi:aminoglycoside-2''-adenylyltransferase
MTKPEWSWEPFSLGETVSLMDGFPGPWWIAAGWAIELHVGSKVREHGDVDILVLREDQAAIRAQLSGWDVRIAHDGRLEPWPDGMQIELPRSGLWARADPNGPWQLQFLLAERDGDEWWYRRDPRIRLPLEQIGLRSRSSAIPYLRPELVLLFKSKHHREEDEADFEAVLPRLDDLARRRLASWLAPDDPWRTRIEDKRVL